MSNAEVSAAERLFRVTWRAALRRGEGGAPTLPAEVVLDLGRSALLVDVRGEAELIGSMGHVPGITWVPAGEIAAVAAALDADAPVILISSYGERSAAAALALEALGMRYVASMAGGMAAWRAGGFVSAREMIGVSREITRPRCAFVAADGAALDVAAIRAHVGDPAAIKRVRVAALLLQTKASCVDGRDQHEVIGTPGGDAGEMLLKLAAVEAMTGRRLTEAQVEGLLIGHLDAFGRFYMHTDLAAINRFIGSMRADPALAEALPPRDSAPDVWRRWNAAPPAACHERILEHLIQPAHVGCGHLRLMMENSEAYGARRGLCESFLRAFFRLRWAGAIEAEYVILGGGHQEGAVVNVLVEEELWPFTKIPLLSPACGGAQIFVNHPQVVDYLRRQLAGFVCQVPGLGLEPGDHEALHERMRELGTIQISRTLERLAKGLPAFEVMFLRSGEVEVRAV